MDVVVVVICGTNVPHIGNSNSSLVVEMEMYEQEAEEEDELLLLRLVLGKAKAQNNKNRWKLCNKLKHNKHPRMNRKTEKVSCSSLFVAQGAEMA